MGIDILRKWMLILYFNCGAYLQSACEAKPGATGMTGKVVPDVFAEVMSISTGSG